MVISGILFYVFAGITVLSALAVISLKNPVHSVLFLIFAFFNAAGLFLLLGAELLAMLLVIVYVGAVAVLFLFVVMMLNINFSKLKEGFLRYLPFGALLAAILLVELGVVIYNSDNALLLPGLDTSVKEISNVEAIGLVLYTDYVLLFQLAGLILLVAMIGAIVLTHRQRDGVRKQNISEQLNRKREHTIEIVKVETGSGAS